MLLVCSAMDDWGECIVYLAHVKSCDNEVAGVQAEVYEIAQMFSSVRKLLDNYPGWRFHHAVNVKQFRARIAWERERSFSSRKGVLRCD